MAKKTTKEPQKSFGERVSDGQNKVNEVMSFFDWIRSVIWWIKGLFGR